MSFGEQKKNGHSSIKVNDRSTRNQMLNNETNQPQREEKKTNLCAQKKRKTIKSRLIRNGATLKAHLRCENKNRFRTALSVKKIFKK